MLHVSLEVYLRSGILGPVRLGLSRQEVRHLLGEPDAVGGTSRKYRTPTILKYGDIELLYRPGEDYLWGIYMDGFDVPQGGSTIDLDPWVIKGGMTTNSIEQALTSAGILFQKARATYDPAMMVITTMGDVELGVESGMICKKGPARCAG